MNTILTEDELPPLQPQDHPEPHSFAWSEQEMRAIRARDRLVEAAVLAKLAAQEPVAYGMPDTQLGRKHRLMMVRLDKGQDGCTMPLYAAPPPAVVQVPQGWMRAVQLSDAGVRLATMLRGDVIVGDFQKALRGCIEAAMLAAAPESPAQAAVQVLMFEVPSIGGGGPPARYTGAATESPAQEVTSPRNGAKARSLLSTRLRPGVECAPWVIEEVLKLEAAVRAALSSPEAPAHPIPHQWVEAMKVAREALGDLVPMVEAMLMIHGTPEPGSVGHKARAALAQLDALGGVE